MNSLQKLVYCVLFGVLSFGTVFAQSTSTEPEKGILRIKLEHELVESMSSRISTRGGVVRTGTEALDNVHRKVKAGTMTRMFPYAPKFEDRMRKYGLHLWYEVRYDNDMTPEAAASLYKAVPGIKSVDVVRKMVLADGSRIIKEDLAPRYSDGYAPFNDPLLKRQWHYNNDGSMDGWEVGSDINLYKAWEITAGSPDVIVAIIDGGVDYQHEDLADNMWSNTAELNGKAGVDDDGNGYVDDFHGWNFVRNSNLVYPHDHGTHVAGTVGAVNNNGIGVGGIAGGTGNRDGVKMMSCQIFDQIEADVDFAKALVYAANSGAVIAQCSWGWNNADYKEQSVLDAIDYFTAEAGNYKGSKMKGGLCIFATGNLGELGDFYPAAYPPAVAVGAMCADYKVATYTNHGKYVDIMAPGGLTEFDVRMGVYSTLPRNQYTFMEGTSMATPHVAGVAALILSKYGNENFTSKELRTQLETAVRDIYQYNPEWRGKVGVGFIDAALALKENKKIAPEAITAFTLFPSQLEADVTWTITSDADDHYIYKHIIYWSNKAFTANSNLADLNSLEVDTKFQTPGTKITEEVGGLQAETMYWFAIQAIDRWGNKSALSPVISGKTNAGPKVAIDKESLNLDVNVAVDYIGQDNFTMDNHGEGLLKWSGIIRQKNMEYQGTSNRSQSPGKVIPFNGKMGSNKPTTYSIVQSDYLVTDLPLQIALHSRSTYNIGELDLSFTNSMAQYYTIDPEAFPQGFNLTHITLPGDQAIGYFIFQIYGDSESITTAPLLLSDTIAHNTPSSLVAYRHNMYFKSGESFWIVVHAPSGNYNPLSIGEEKEATHSKGSFYSSDMGKTWSLLEDILKPSNMSKEAATSVWATTLTSNQLALDGYITMNLTSGNVSPNTKGTVEIQTTKSDIIDGNYNFDVILKTNETGKEQRVIPITLNLTGHKPQLHTAKVVNFGDLFIGQSKTMNVEVVNSGYGAFSGEWGMMNAESSDSQFIIDPNMSINQFTARSRMYLPIKYAPLSAGTHISTITLTDANNIKHSFMVRGIADEPAKIEVTPTNIAVGDLNYGDVPKEFNISIKNTGNYPLEYVFSQFSDDTLTGIKKTSHKLGYSYIESFTNSTTTTPTYEWNELTNAINVQKELVDGVYWTKPVSVGFRFPFYNEHFSEIYIGSYGALSMTGKGNIHASVPPTSNDLEEVGIISAFGATSLGFDKQSKLLYANQNGKFVVSYENVLLLCHDGGYTRISFRIALCENGDIEMHYKDIEPIYETNEWNTPRFPSQNILIGCTDIPALDAFIITEVGMTLDEGSNLYQQLKNESAIKIIAPGRSMVQKIDYPSGVVSVNTTKDITLTVAADSNMYVGALKNILTLICSDPTQTTSYVTLEANVKGDVYKPLVELNTTNLDFGTQFKTTRLEQAVGIKNIGKASVQITSLDLENDNMVLTPISLPFELKAGLSVDALITVPSQSEGSVSNILTVKTSNGQTLTASINANIIGTPDIVVAPTAINVSLEGGATKGSVLELRNSGNEDLTFRVEPNIYVYPSDPTITQGDEADYVHASSTNDSNVVFDWIDITKTATEHYRIEYLAYHDYITIPLPEKITFYGEQYDTAYVFGSGFICFQYYPDAGGNMPNPPLEIPSLSNAYINYIAPFWGLHTPDQVALAGIYYEQRAEGLVISFMDYGNTMNSGICFQTIISKEGIIKFQYMVLPGGQFMSLFGNAGIENKDHSKGVKLLERYVKGDKLAVEFYPVKMHTLKPGENKKINMIADARKLLKGEYQDELFVSTNVPTKKEVSVPVTLNVSGKAQPEFPESVDFGDAIIGSMKPQEIIIEVVNKGNAAFSITNFKLKNSSDEPWTDPILLNPIFDNGGGSAPSQDWMPGEPIVIGKTPQKFAILLNLWVLNSPELITNTIEFTTDLPGQQGFVEIPVTANVVESPVMNIHQGKMEFYAPINTMTFDSVFYVSNKEGKHKLDYTIDIAFSNAAAKTATASTIPMGAMPKGTVAVKTRSMGVQKTDDSEYTNELKHETTGKPITFLGSGDKLIPFSASTAYTAPAQGFNIAAIECYANVTGAKFGEIKAEIRVGDYFSTAKTIGQGTLKINDQDNAYRTIVLDKPVYINPHETFYLFLTFPLGAEFPLAFIAAGEKNIGGRYHIYVNEEWVDLIRYEATYGPIALVIRCLEKEAGSPWISVKDENEGVIAKNDSAQLTVHVNASTARFMKGNLATVSINGNANENSSHSFTVRLDKNYAPEITQVSESIKVRENDTTEVLFKVRDIEEDNFTVAATDESGIVSYALNSNDLKVTLRPKYEQAGTQSFKITATDEHKNENIKIVEYYVEKTNRTPIVVETPQAMKIHLGDILEGIDMTQVFSDPDGDTLRYVVSTSDESIVKAFVKDHILEFTQKTTGDVTVSLSAYDPSGLFAQTSFEFEILNTQRASSGEKITVYPNPVIYLLNIRCSADINGNVTLRMYDMSGNIVYVEQTVLDGDITKSLDMSSYSSGVYILEIEHKEGKTSTKVVKQ